MQSPTGIVTNGRVVVEGVDLPEGTRVTVMPCESDEYFDIPPELEADLRASMEELERGQFITAEELFKSLRRIA